MKPLALLLALCLVILGRAQAQQETEATPHPPYLATVPDYGHWKVTFKPLPDPKAKMDEAPKPGEPKPEESSPLPLNMIEIIKTGDMMLVTLTTAGSPPKIFYQRGEWMVTLNPQNAQQAQVIVPSPDHLPYPYYTTGFTLLDGMVLSQETFKGLVKYNNVPAFHYETAGSEVWIAPETMFPIAVKSTQQAVIAEYEFLPSPPAPFQIPKDQASLLQKEQNAYKAVRSMR